MTGFGLFVWKWNELESKKPANSTAISCDVNVGRQKGKEFEGNITV